MSKENATAQTPLKKKRKFEMPDALVIIIAMCILAMVLTYVVPAGTFERVMDENMGREVVNADSYTRVEQSPVGLFRAFVLMTQGFDEASNIAFMCFFGYAIIFVLMESGALYGGLNKLMRKLNGAEILLIPLFMLVFGLAGTTYGETEAIYGLVPVFVGLAIALGYDAIVGLAMSYGAIVTGYASGTSNPYSVVIAQNISELPLFSGYGYRWVIWFVMMGIIIAYTMRYALKIKKDPEKSIVKDVDFGTLSMDRSQLDNAPFSGKHKLMLLVFVVVVAFLVIGGLKLGWWINEMSAAFLIGTIVCSIIAGYGPNKMTRMFIEAASQMVTAVCVIGFARGIVLILNEGNIIDSIVYYLSAPLTALPSWLAAEGMYVFHNIINGIITSGSGMTAVVMPIMTPMADLLDIPRQVACLACQFGDGYTNMLWPTASIAIVLGISKIPFQKWYKFFLPLLGLFVIACMIFIALPMLVPGLFGAAWVM